MENVSQATVKHPKETRELMLEFSESEYVRGNGMTIVEVNHWLKRKGVDIPWSSIYSLLEQLVAEGKLNRVTSLGRRDRLAGNISIPYIYWPKKESTSQIE